MSQPHFTTTQQRPEQRLSHSRNLIAPIGDNRVIVVTGEQGSGKTAALRALLSALPEGTPVRGIVNEAAGSSTDMDVGSLKGSLSSASIVGVPGWICCRDSADVLKAVRGHRADLQAKKQNGLTVIEQSGFLPAAPVAAMLRSDGFFPYVIDVVRHDQLGLVAENALSRYAVPNLRLAHAVIVAGLSESDSRSAAVRDRIYELRQGSSFEPFLHFRPGAESEFSPQLWNASQMEPALRVRAMAGPSIVTNEPPEVEYLTSFREIGLTPYRGVTSATLRDILAGLHANDGTPVAITRAKGFLDGVPVHVIRTDRGLVLDPAPDRRQAKIPSTFAHHLWVRGTDGNLGRCARYFAQHLGTPRFAGPSEPDQAPAPTDLEMRELADYLSNMSVIVERDPSRAGQLTEIGASMLARFLEHQSALITEHGLRPPHERLDLTFFALAVAVHPHFDLLFSSGDIPACLSSADERFWAADPFGVFHRAFLDAPDLRIGGDTFLYKANAAMLRHIVNRGVEGGYLSEEQLSGLRNHVRRLLPSADRSWQQFADGLG